MRLNDLEDVRDGLQLEVRKILKKFGKIDFMEFKDMSDLLVGDETIHSDRIIVDCMNMKEPWTCCDVEKYHLSILFPDARLYEDDTRRFSKQGRYYRKGVMLRVNGESIGYVKLKGNKTFLSTKSVIDSSGKYRLLKYSICGISKNLEKKLPVVEGNEWGVLNIERLYLSFGRFLYPN